MKILTLTSVLLILSLVNKSLSVSKATELKDDYCDKDSLSDVNYSVDKMDDIRDERDNEFSNNYKDIMNFLRDPNENSDDLFDAFLVESIFLIIFLFVLLVSAIVFLFFCCGMCKNAENRTKFCTTLACFGFWVFVLLFIVIIVFLSLA